MTDIYIIDRRLAQWNGEVVTAAHVSLETLSKMQPPVRVW